MVGKKRLARFLERVEGVGPDMRASSGNLVDGQLNYREDLAAHQQ